MGMPAEMVISEAISEAIDRRIISGDLKYKPKPRNSKPGTCN